MRSICVFLSALGLVATAAGQSRSVTTRPGVSSGTNYPMLQADSTDGERTLKAQSINGREVPIEERVTRVIKDTPRERVVEVSIQRYSRTGAPNQRERIVTQETFGAGGSVTTNQNFYRSDGSGNMQEIERRQSQTRRRGSGRNEQTETDTTVQRVDLNGAFRPAEKIREVTTGPPDERQTTASLSRVDANHRFTEVQRTLTTVTQQGDETTTSTNIYRPGAKPDFELMEQTVTQVTDNPDGTQQTVVTHYGASPAGTLRSAEAKPVLVEQDIITQQLQQDGSVKEVTTLRQPTISDPNRLGASRTISETVCRGKGCLKAGGGEAESLEQPVEGVGGTEPPQQPSENRGPGGAVIRAPGQSPTAGIIRGKGK